MSLIHRNRSDVDWPDLFGARMFDVPTAWKDLFDDSDMKVEEFRDGDTLVVRAEMPGIDPDKDVEITVCRRDAPPERRAPFRDQDRGQEGLPVRVPLRLVLAFGAPARRAPARTT